MHRPVCYRCRKAQTMCYCDELQAFASQPSFVILLHPKETRKAINTGRMAALLLSNARLLVGCDFSEDRALNQLLADPARRCVLLFPGPEAQDLADFRLGMEDLESKELTFIILDGTWAMAKKMFRASPNLQALPQVMFHPNKPSRYTIRQQPQAHCYATIETIHHVIDELGTHPEGEHQRLLDLFDTMVRKQIEYEERNRLLSTLVIGAEDLPLHLEKL